MPSFGGYVPGAERYGGSLPRVKLILDALNAARGTAYDTSSTSPVWVENLALARAIAEVWDVNELLSNQRDPRKASVSLARWEKICRLSPLPSDTPAQRRAALTALVSSTGVEPNYQEMLDRVSAAVSPVTVSIVHTGATETGGIVHWPGAWYVQCVGDETQILRMWGSVSTEQQVVVEIVDSGDFGVGTYVLSTDGGYSWTDLATIPSTITLASGLSIQFWSETYTAGNRYTSNVGPHGWHGSAANVTFLMAKPSWMTEARYYDLVSKASSILERMMPAWVFFTIARDGSVPGSFVLDESSNLDNQRFG